MIYDYGIPDFMPIQGLDDLREQLPTIFNNSLSDAQRLVSVINCVNRMGLIIGEIADNWAVVESWIKENGVDSAVESLLSRWAEDGTLSKILDKTALNEINKHISVLEQELDKTVDDNKNYVDQQVAKMNSNNTLMWNNVISQINEKLSGGAIKEVFATVDELKSKYPNGSDGVFLVIADKHLYYWEISNKQWVDAGSYASNVPNNDSINVKQLKPNGQTPIFTPSRDGIPNYDTTTGVLDFMCNSDNAYFSISNTFITVPTGLKVVNDLAGDYTSAKLIYDREKNNYKFITWNTPLTENQTLLGTLRHGYDNTTNAYYWTGTFDIAIDGRQQNQRDIPAHTIFSPGNAKKPNFNTKTREFDFGSTTTTTPTIQMGTKVIQIPNGTVATPTEGAMNANTLRVVYNVYDASAKVVAWNEVLPPNTVVVCLVIYNYTGHPFITGGFPYTINGQDPNLPKNNIDFVPSMDGYPIFDAVKKQLDFNCYTDNAYIIYEGKSYQVPRNLKVDATQFTSTKFTFKPDDNSVYAHAWSDPIPDGEIVLFSIRTGTHNNETLTSGSIPLVIKGQSFHSYATENPVDAKIKGINHRGFNTVAPEESKSAYLLSKQNGYLHWEGDINWTRDSVPMMIHDLAINRTARDLKGNPLPATVNINEISYADLAKYDFGIVKGERFAGEPLLTFEELVKLARYNNAFLHIEFKYQFTQDQVQMLHDIVVKYNMLDRIGWQAFGWDWLKPMMALEPNGQYELLGGEVNDDYFTRLASFKTATNRIVASQNASLSVDDIQKISDAGYPIYLWTVDDGATARKFRDIGNVEGIMTNGAINVTDEITKE